MATKITSRVLADDAIVRASLGDDAIGVAEIADDAVTTAAIADDVALGGNPTTTTQSTANSSTRIATTAFVQAAIDTDISALIDSAPGTLNTLDEIAAALNDDPTFTTTVNNAIALKAPIASPVFTGNATFDSPTLYVDGSNNRVGVGTTGPGINLDIKSSGSNGNVGARIWNTGTQANDDAVLGFLTQGNRNYSIGIHRDSGRFTIASADMSVASGELLSITNAGNVGIGETNPAVPLHISKDSASGENIALLLDNNNTTAGNEIGILFRSMVGSTNTDFEIFGVANASNDMDLVFESDGSDERVRFTGDGKVGIGTPDPLSPLSVQADSGAGVARFIGRAADSIASVGFYNNAQNADIYLQSNGSWFRARADGGFHFRRGNTPVVTDVDGFTIQDLNVGIGTTSPDVPLEIAGETRIYPSSGTGILRFGSGGAEKGRLSVDSSSNMVLETAGSTALTLDSSQNVTLAGTLGVTGLLTATAGITTPANQRIQASSGMLFLSGPSAIAFENGAGSEKMRLSSGKLLIGDLVSHTSDLLQIETPASGGGHGIQIRRNDANTDQGIGHILFGNNTATDLVKISAKTDGDSNAGDSGALLFHTQVTGGNLTERMRIDSAGEVLIATSTADGTSKLVIGEYTANDATQYGAYVRRGGTASTTGTWPSISRAAFEYGSYWGEGPSSFVQHGDAINISYGRMVTTDSNTANGAIMDISYDGAMGPLRLDLRGNMWLGYNRSTAPTSSETHSLFVTGKVGIGTTSPSAPLHIYTSASSGVNIGLQNSERYWKMQTDGGFLTFNDVSAGDLARLVIDTSGNVGINVTDPDCKLEIKGAGGTTGLTFKTTDSASNETFFVQDGGRVGVRYYPFTIGTASGTAAPSSTRMFIDGSATDMTVTDDGHLLIGETATVAGAYLTVSSNNGEGLTVGRAGSNAYRNYRHVTSSGIHQFISSGNTASLSNAGAWTNASDISYKKDIVDTQYGLETIKKLRPRDFVLKIDDTPDTGFIAQELETVLPQFVIGEEGDKNVNYAQLTAVLTKAIQELEARIATLEG